MSQNGSRKETIALKRVPLKEEREKPEIEKDVQKSKMDGLQTKKNNVTQQIIQLDQIESDPYIQPRLELNHKTVDEYAEELEMGTIFPPIDVFFAGMNFLLVDGFHRFNATQKIGKSEILANIHYGSRRDAILYSVGLNASHGLRRTNADKHRAVNKLLSDSEWRQWSDGEIAKASKVSQSFVSKLRRESTQNETKSGKRIGADGRTIDTSNIGKKPQEKEVTTNNQVPAPETSDSNTPKEINEESNKDAGVDQKTSDQLTTGNKVTPVDESDTTKSQVPDEKAKERAETFC